MACQTLHYLIVLYFIRSSSLLLYIFYKPNPNTTPSLPPPTRDCIRTVRHIPLSPPSPNSHPPYLPYIHPTLHSRANSTPANPTRPSTHSPPYTILPPDTPYPSQTGPLQHLNTTHLPHHTHSTYYCTLQTLIPPTAICPPAAKTLISPSKAHMSLGGFCGALTIEYVKCKTPNINKCLQNCNEQRLNTDEFQSLMVLGKSCIYKYQY